MSRYITSTGRAKGPGRVTRSSLHIRKRAKGQRGGPLPLELMCHPKKLSPTTRNPQCYTLDTKVGKMDYLLKTMTVAKLWRGVGLGKDGRFSVVETTNGRKLGHTDDAVYALAYAKAASQLGLPAQVLDLTVEG